jgi:DNA-binding transcriptional MerR regulator/methylmalonyl-CoA mutase cobalamin-binding subunit
MPSTEASEGLWSMGAVVRRTGIGEHTLRAWERRFGFPRPERLPSGHRRYPADQVRRLILINQALNCGYRAGDVVPLSRERLEAVVAECVKAGTASGAPAEAWVGTILEKAREFDREGLTAELQQEASTLGVGRFLRERVEPLLVGLGDAWLGGDIQIRHEHFAANVLEDVLRSLRVPLEPGTAGRPIVLASLPDEPHTLGLLVVALALAADGRSVRMLGSRSPAEEIALTAEEIDAAAVGLSISEYSVGTQTAGAVGDLRRRLSPRIELWLGGTGAGQLVGLSDDVEIVTSLDDLARVTGQLDIERAGSA